MILSYKVLYSYKNKEDLMLIIIIGNMKIVHIIIGDIEDVILGIDIQVIHGMDIPVSQELFLMDGLQDNILVQHYWKIE